MTTSKLLDKLRDILNADRKAQRARYDALKNVLMSLHEKRMKLNAELEQCDDQVSQAEIESKLKIVSKQREKGVELLKKLKEERGEHKPTGERESQDN